MPWLAALLPLEEVSGFWKFASGPWSRRNQKRLGSFSAPKLSLGRIGEGKGYTRRCPLRAGGGRRGAEETALWHCLCAHVLPSGAGWGSRALCPDPWEFGQLGFPAEDAPPHAPEAGLVSAEESSQSRAWGQGPATRETRIPEELTQCGLISPARLPRVAPASQAGFPPHFLIKAPQRGPGRKAGLPAQPILRDSAHVSADPSAWNGGGMSVGPPEV